ncbi:MAG: glycine cleavage T C-terminal barrel domain-containing protein, partial [Candidatus Promineifilaceae bacterium]
LDKAEPFIGREALGRIKAEGPRRKLVGVEIGGAPLAFNMTRWPVSAEGEAAGFITSAVWSPRLKRNIGYANLPAGLARLGAPLTVRLPDGDERPATVVPKPFVDPDKDIPKS